MASQLKSSWALCPLAPRLSILAAGGRYLYSLSNVKDFFCSHEIIKMVCMERNVTVASRSVVIADNATNPRWTNQVWLWTQVQAEWGRSGQRCKDRLAGVQRKWTDSFKLQGRWEWRIWECHDGLWPLKNWWCNDVANGKILFCFHAIVSRTDPKPSSFH